MNHTDPGIQGQKIGIASLLEWVSLTSIVLFIAACFHIYLFYNLYDLPIFSFMDFSEAIPQAFQNLVSVFGVLFVFMLFMALEGGGDRPATYLYLIENLSQEGGKPELEQFLENETARQWFTRKIGALLLGLFLFLGFSWLSNRMEDLVFQPDNPFKHTGLVSAVETFMRKNVVFEHLIIDLFWFTVVMFIYVTYERLVVVFRRKIKLAILLLMLFFAGNALFSAYDKYVFLKRTQGKNSFTMTLADGSTIASRKGFYYIGQTKNAVFFYNTKEKRATVFMMNEVASLKMLPTSIFY